MLKAHVEPSTPDVTKAARNSKTAYSSNDMNGTGRACKHPIMELSSKQPTNVCKRPNLPTVEKELMSNKETLEEFSDYSFFKDFQNVSLDLSYLSDTIPVKIIPAAFPVVLAVPINGMLFSCPVQNRLSYCGVFKKIIQEIDNILIYFTRSVGNVKSYMRDQAFLAVFGDISIARHNLRSIKVLFTAAAISCRWNICIPRTTIESSIFHWNSKFRPIRLENSRVREFTFRYPASNTSNEKMINIVENRHSLRKVHTKYL